MEKCSQVIIEGKKKFITYQSEHVIMKNHENELFCTPNNKDLVNVVEYQIIDQNDRGFKYKIPYPVYKTIKLLSNYPEFSIWSNIKNSNSNYYRKKWIYQIINGVYEIHEKRNTFIGNLSDECITIDDQLNAKIEFLSYFPSLESQFKYFYLYYEPIRIKNREKIDDFDRNADTYKKYDIFALGEMINEVLTFQKMSIDDEHTTYTKLENEKRYTSNDAKNLDGNSNEGKNDEDFSQQITNNIINLCFLPFDERPSIKQIREKMKEIFPDLNLEEEFNSPSDDYDINSLQISTFLKNNHDMINYFYRDPNNQKVDYFKLNNSCQFETYYDNDCFHTVPDIVDDKFENEFYQTFFFSNIYFCNLKDLLKVYTSKDRDILYWFLYLSDYIFNMHEQGHFLPHNFTIENILVSFLTINDDENSSNFAQKVCAINDIQIQLSIFPYEIQNVENPGIYACPDLSEKSEQYDVYSFGVLMLEILYKFSTGIFLFQEDPKALKDLKALRNKDEFNKIKSEISKDWIPLLNFIAICIFSYQDLTFQQIQEELVKIIDGKPKLEVAPLFDYCKNHPKMSDQRFISLFRCYASMERKNLIIVFNNRINCLLNDFNSESLIFDPDLILKHIESIKKDNENKQVNEFEEEITNNENKQDDDNNDEETKNRGPIKLAFIDFDLSNLPEYIKKSYYDEETIEKEALYQALEDLTKTTAKSIISKLIRFSSGSIVDMEVINSYSSDDLLTMDYLEQIVSELEVTYTKIIRKGKDLLRLFIEPQGNRTTT